MQGLNSLGLHNTSFVVITILVSAILILLNMQYAAEPLTSFGHSDQSQLQLSVTACFDEFYFWPVFIHVRH